jgi:hypothetical protein
MNFRGKELKDGMDDKLENLRIPKADLYEKIDS